MSLQQILRDMFAPIAWLLGVPWNDCRTIGNLLGTRLVLNEFIAFHRSGPIKEQLDPHSFTIATYALCGLPTSAPSRFRSAASERWRRAANPIWRAWACARWPPGPWPISCRPASRACCFKMQRAVAYIRELDGREPRVAVVLGSGLGAFADELDESHRVIPTPIFPAGPFHRRGHAGKLVFGNWREPGRRRDGRPRSSYTKATRRLKDHGRSECCTSLGSAFGGLLPTPPAASICRIRQGRWC
jgi:hypothetical protein